MIVPGRFLDTTYGERWKAKLEKSWRRAASARDTCPGSHGSDCAATDKRRADGSASACPVPVAFTVYAFAGVTVPMLLLFAGGWWLPKTVDTGPHLSTAPSVVINVALVALFGLQHSGMARPAFKAFLTRWVPEALERTVYIVMACLAVWVLCLGWQPLPHRIWSSDGIVGWVLDAGFWLGFALVYAATLLLNHFHLLGLSQAYRAYVTQVRTQPPIGCRCTVRTAWCGIH